LSARLLREESGVVLGLAIVLVVLIGVMGAGLLTVVASDLQATVEANQGQRAFEMAEAGIEVAKARLAEDPGLSDWSSGELRMERMEGGTGMVTLERSDEGGTRYVATSTGEYSGARRRIEATLSVAGGEPDLLRWRELYE
jgi:Tfp pilus assembly protein PilX